MNRTRLEQNGSTVIHLNLRCMQTYRSSKQAGCIDAASPVIFSTHVSHLAVVSITLVTRFA